MTEISVRNFTRRPTPRLAFQDIAQAALPGWEISLVFAGASRAKRMNEMLRKKSYVPNVLSYETGTKSGEIIICLEVAKKQAPEYGMGYAEFVAYLLIHGMLHLKGYPHGTTMEGREARLMRGLGVSTSNETTHRNGNRHRHTSDKGGRGRRGRGA